MANFDKLVPFILHWETGARITGTDPMAAYAKASAKGVINDPNDRGGATMCGVTIGTFTDWCSKHGRPQPTVADLARMDYQTWREIAKSGFWNRCKADTIKAQGVANMLVDWCYTSGNYAITNTQRALGLKVDGVVGPKTLAALNGSSEIVFRLIKAARVAYYRSIAKGNQARYLTGWLNRTESITLTSLILR